jgi:hypothetical protein
MPAGRPAHAHAGTLYAFAHQFYWDFRRLAEGSQRAWFDGRAYEQLEKAIEQTSLDPTDRQNARIHEVLDDEIQGGRVEPTHRDEWLRSVRDSQRAVNRESLRWRAAEAATTMKTIPSERGVLDALLKADTPACVRAICKDAYVTTMLEVEPGVNREVEVPNWPLPMGSVLPLYLSLHAEAFVAAKNDRRYPESLRASSRLKQLWFLSRALAGAVFDVRPRTAINLVGSTRPEEAFEDSRAAKPARRKKKARKTPRTPRPIVKR